MNPSFRVYRRNMFLLLTAVYVMEMFFRNCLNVAKDTLEGAFDLGASAWGMLGSAYLYPQVLFLVVFGVVVDHFDIRKVFIAATAAVTAGSLLFAAAPNAAVLVLGRCLTGFGEGLLFPAFVKYLGLWYGKKEQDRMMGIATAVAYAVGMMALSPLSFLLERVPWRYVYAIPMLVTLSLLLLICRKTASLPSHKGFEAPPDSDAAKRGEPVSLKESLIGMGRLVAQRRMWPPMVMMMGIFGASNVLNGVWGSSFLAEAYGLTMTQASEQLLFVLVGTAVAAVAAPDFSQWVGSRRIPLMIDCLGLTVCWAALILGAGRLSVAALRVVLLLIGVFNSATVMGLLLFKEMNPPGQVGASVAVYTMSTSVGGCLTGVLVGVVYETLGESLSNYKLALCSCVGILLIGFVCSCMTETDCKRMGAAADDRK